MHMCWWQVNVLLVYDDTKFVERQPMQHIGDMAEDVGYQIYCIFACSLGS